MRMVSGGGNLYTFNPSNSQIPFVAVMHEVHSNIANAKYVFVYSVIPCTSEMARNVKID